MKSRIPNQNDIFKVATNIAVKHTLAYTLYTLDTKYGFKKDRLEKFMCAISEVVKNSTNGSDISSTEMLTYLKSKYNIDLERISH